MPGPSEHLSAVRGVALPGRVLGLLAPALGQELLQLWDGSTQISEAGRGLRQDPNTPSTEHPFSDVPSALAVFFQDHTKRMGHPQKSVEKSFFRKPPILKLMLAGSCLQAHACSGSLQTPCRLVLAGSLQPRACGLVLAGSLPAPCRLVLADSLQRRACRLLFAGSLHARVRRLPVPAAGATFSVR